MAATSSFTEGSVVFGGQANLLQAIQNIFTVYQPDVIAVHTTCLSETIGDDIPQIAEKAAEQGKIPGQVRHPRQYASYVGSHVTGFANMVKGMRTPSAPWPWASGLRRKRPATWTPSTRCPAAFWTCLSDCWPRTVS
jgi:nitrogenase molybdenum-iron protein beta chain